MEFYWFSLSFMHRRVGLYKDVKGTEVDTECKEKKEKMTQYSKNTSISSSMLIPECRLPWTCGLENVKKWITVQQNPTKKEAREINNNF